MEKYLKKNRLIFCFLVLAGSIYGALSAIVPITAGMIIDSVHGLNEMDHGLLTGLLSISVAELLLVLFFGGAKAVLKTKFIRKVRTEMEADLFHAAVRTNIEPMKFINMFCVEAEQIIDKYYTVLDEFAGIIIPFAIALVYSVAISWATILIIVLCFIAVILLNQVMLSPLSKYMESLSKSNESVNKALMGFLGAITSLKVYGGIDYAYQQINDILRKRNKAETDKAEYGLFVEGINCLFSTLMQIIPLAIVAVMVINGKLNIGTALSIMLLFEKIVSPIDSISALRGEIAETASYRRHFADVIGGASDFETLKCGTPAPADGGKVTIDKLCVTIGEKPIIADFNASFDAGKKYLLVGANGAGKTTLRRILTKEIEEYEGNVSVFGKELKEMDSEALFELVGVIPQTIEIFEDTLQNNITLGKPADRSRLKKALEQAGLPEKRLDEQVTEGWRNLSGGELQRLALARMFYNPKKIYLLDEVTSGLEYGLAKMIESAILAIPDTMIIHISHRSDETLIKKYDAVINMSEENKTPRLAVQ